MFTSSFWPVNFFPVQFWAPGIVLNAPTALFGRSAGFMVEPGILMNESE